MSGLKRIRPLAGMGAPLKVRYELGRSLSRWLSKWPAPEGLLPQIGTVPGTALLELVSHYRVDYPGAYPLTARDWDESAQRLKDGDLTFEGLVSAGWLFFDGSKWVMPHPPVGLSHEVVYPSQHLKTFLSGLVQPSLVANEPNPPDAAQALAVKIDAEGWLKGGLPVRLADRDWVAGRLWERLCADAPVSEEGDDKILTSSAPDSVVDPADALAVEDPSGHVAFRTWHAWCLVLGSSGKWDIAWSSNQQQRCRDAAHQALATQTMWGDWASDARRYFDVLANTFAIPSERLRYSAQLPRPAPRTLVAKVDWLNEPAVEQLNMERLDGSAATFAFDVLCSELERTGTGPGISSAASRLLAVATERPMTLQSLLFRVRAVPALLADMLLHSPTACLAARLVIEWRHPFGNDNPLNVERDEQTKAFAVEDALSLVVHHLGRGVADIEELTALITWCYAAAFVGDGVNVDTRRLSGRRLLVAVAERPAEVQTAALGYLVDQACIDGGVRSGMFSGVLDALSLLPAAQVAAAAPIAGLYTAFARDLHLERTDASSLSPELAARLVSLALSQTESERDALLVPVDAVALVRAAPDEEKSSVRTSIALMLRDHVRLLARAVKAWPSETVPRELSDALQKLVSLGSIEHAEKNKIGALTDRYSSMRIWLKERGTPAEDLAAAWRRLDGTRQQALMRSLEKTDDPVLLAELCQHLPAAAKISLQEKLRLLQPNEAARPWTWSELEHRVTALLEAGEYPLAREYLDEGSVNIEKAPAAHRLTNFGLHLQLLTKEQNWAAIDAMPVPTGLDQLSERQAQQHLQFYKATSQLLRPDGQVAAAGATLRRLAAAPGAAPAFRENAYAAALRELVGAKLQPFAGDNRRKGAELLDEMDSAISESVRSGRPSSNSLLTNRAIVLLALERPADAFEGLAARRAEKRTPELELFAALARKNMGYPGEALSILDDAIADFGEDDRLVEARNDLRAGVAPNPLPSASLVVDPVISTREAILQLPQMQPSQVADILGPPGGGLRGYLVREVSKALGALQSMVAMLRGRTNADDEAKIENDLNTAMRAVLGAALSVQKWDVADQSLAGSTARGNPGERDAVVRVSGQEIAIYEGLVLSSLNRTTTKSHFDKLFSYGIVDIYFHVTYSYAPALKPLLDYILDMAEHEVPAGLTFLDCTALGQPDYATSGHLARYGADHREIAVAFLVVDLRQGVGRSAVEVPAPTQTTPPAPALALPPPPAA